MKESPDRALKPAEGTVEPGQGFYNAFKCVLFQLSVVTDELAFRISEIAETDRHQVNKCPDSAASCSKEHEDAGSNLAGIEPVDTEASAEKAQK